MFVCVSFVARAAEAEKKVSVDATEITVDMAPYVVHETRVLPLPESWRYVSVPALWFERGNESFTVAGYEVLSNESEKNTRLFVSELQLRQFAGAYLWPMLVKLQPKQPMVVILDRTKQAWLPSDGTDSYSWSGDPIAEADAGAADFTSNAFDSGAWLVESEGVSEWDMIDGMNSPGEVVADASTRYGYQPAETSVFSAKGGRLPLPPGFVTLTFREGLIAAQVNADQPLASAARPTEEQLAANLNAWTAVAGLQSLPGGAPRWFEAGLHRLIELTDATPTRLTFGRGVLNTPTKRFASLEAVLLKTSPFNEEEKLMAAAFVHHGLYGQNGKYAQQFMTFTERVGKESFSRELFKECFGKTIKQRDLELESYARTFAAYRSIETRGKIPPMPEFTVREATQSEAARLQADALISQGKPDKALDLLRIAYWRGEREPAMLAVLAMLEERLGAVDRAGKISQTLMKLPDPPVRVLSVAAKLRYREVIATKSMSEKLTVAETQPILKLLAQSIKGGQGTEDVWALFSEIVLRGAGRPHESIGVQLAQASKRYPANKTIQAAAVFAGQAL